MLDKILELLPKSVSLHYIDRRDNLNGQEKVLQECISKGNKESLYELVDDWCMGDHYGFDCVEKELRSDMEISLGLSEEEVEELFDEYQDQIQDAINDRDDSDMAKDLLRNTNKFVMFYDTGHEVESWFPMSEAKCRLERYKLKKLLSINTSDYNELIDQMLYQAGYGGNLHIYFRDDVDDFLEIDGEVNTIGFRGEVHIGVVNSGNGSGDVTSFKMDFKLPFSRNNLWIDKCTSYNWTYDIAGMCHDWCDSTSVSLLIEAGVVKQEEVESSMAKHMRREAEYQKTYAAGSCTLGDTNINRHRNTPYHNDPMYCRNECVKCGQVWID